jgi:site-specific DNA-methyltransferase (adenine-specific)
MATGSTGIAAVELGRRFIGIELSEDYCAIAKARIEAAVIKQEAALFEQPPRRLKRPLSTATPQLAL